MFGWFKKNKSEKQAQTVTEVKDVKEQSSVEIIHGDKITNYVLPNDPSKITLEIATFENIKQFDPRIKNLIQNVNNSTVGNIVCAEQVSDSFNNYIYNYYSETE